MSVDVETKIKRSKISMDTENTNSTMRILSLSLKLSDCALWEFIDGLSTRLSLRVDMQNEVSWNDEDRLSVNLSSTPFKSF